ncbi:MAG TPA: gluconate 2-dehydrogenase subunit 3 family protein [Candidatus Acidoferrum sp.]|nr:gluconate 2-dehydrogenase subunit 3 family protein [Candidatus Acidoferrum sp.]
MNRRDALRMLTAGAVLPALTPELFAFYQQAHPGASYTLRTLNPHVNATVVAMIDQIIPATDTPGAKDARVNEFIDVILTEWATEEERKNFLDGLAAVDKESNELFGKDFASASPAQQVTLLRSMDEAAAVLRAQRQRHAPNTVPEPDAQLKGDFFSVFKNITLHGYYTSEVAFTKELNLEIIPGAFHGCTPVTAQRKA